VKKIKRNSSKLAWKVNEIKLTKYNSKYARDVDTIKKR
jgi:hypothetical protein